LHSTQNSRRYETHSDFAREVVAPAAEELDRNHTFGYDIVRQMGELAFSACLSARTSAARGGFSFPVHRNRGDLARRCGVGITLEAAVCLGSSPIYEFGTKQQKERWLPDLVAGRKLWAFGLTEPEAGSDAGATKTRAEARNGTW